MSRRKVWQPPDYVAPDVPRRLMTAASSARDRALIAVLYYAGLRRFEAAALSIQDVDLAHRRLVVQHGKGDKRGVLPLSDALARELRTYLSVMGFTIGPLFRGRKAGKDGDHRITPWSVWDTVRRLAVRAELDPNEVHTHSLRHAFVTHLLEKGVPIHEVRDLARHGSLSTTSIYANADTRRLFSAANRLGEADDAL